MLKVIAGVFMGVFVGALAYEIINRENPELLQKMRDFVCRPEEAADKDEDEAEAAV